MDDFTEHIAFFPTPRLRDFTLAVIRADVLEPADLVAFNGTPDEFVEFAVHCAFACIHEPNDKHAQVARAADAYGVEGRKQ